MTRHPPPSLPTCSLGAVTYVSSLLLLSLVVQQDAALLARFFQQVDFQP